VDKKILRSKNMRIEFRSYNPTADKIEKESGLYFYVFEEEDGYRVELKTKEDGFICVYMDWDEEKRKLDRHNPFHFYKPCEMWVKKDAKHICVNDALNEFLSLIKGRYIHIVKEFSQYTIPGRHPRLKEDDGSVDMSCPAEKEANHQ
jgi:hypothetical protein